MYEKYAGTRVSTKNHAHEKNEEKKTSTKTRREKKSQNKKVQYLRLRVFVDCSCS